MDDLLKQGKKAYNAGDLESARKFFAELIIQTPDDEQAWEWMAKVCSSDRERILCLLQVIKINPTNQNARETLLRLKSPKPADNPATETRSETIRRPELSMPLIITGVLLLIVLFIGVFLGGIWVQKYYSSKIPLAASESIPSQQVQLPALTTDTPLSATGTPSVTFSRTPRPSFTPYPTNTPFTIPTWTPTPGLPIVVIPVNPATDSPQPTQPSMNEPQSTPKTNPTPRSNPTKTPKPNISLECNVDPNVVKVATNTTMTIFAQLYQDGKAIKTTAITAEWKDSQNRNFHCVSSSNSCQGQSGYLFTHAQSIINIGVNSPSGERFNCQTIYRTP